jgi:hypothetical protein
MWKFCSGGSRLFYVPKGKEGLWKALGNYFWVTKSKPAAGSESSLKGS